MLKSATHTTADSVKRVHTKNGTCSGSAVECTKLDENIKTICYSH